jgi:hypothetical protein
MKSHKSTTIPINVGCVQLYMSGINKITNVDHYVTYVDDSYVVIVKDIIKAAKTRLTQISTKHIAELRSRGMKVNKSKT